jgi:AraC-like DNA-binding protein
MDVLGSYVARTGDATVGLRAGESLDPGDFEPLERAARCCTNLREAIQFFARYISLMNEAAEMSVVEAGDEALWRFRTTDGVPQVPAANDFILACAQTFARRCAGPGEREIEVHLMHPQPAYAAAYQGAFPRRLRFGMPHNGFLLKRESLKQRLPHPQPGVLDLFEKRLRLQVDDLSAGVRREVAALVIAELPSGRLSMNTVARKLSMSVATLGRRLKDEGASFGQIVDETRRAIAETYLRASRMSVSEIAFLVGFSNAPAFHSAFRRWTGMSPSGYRTLVLKQGSGSLSPT